MNHRIRRQVRWGRISMVIAALALGGAILVLLVRFYPYSWNFSSFPRVTRTAAGTAAGTAADPINLVFVGSQEQMTQSFHQAGWLTPDPITPQTIARIAADSLAHRSYPTAPVSNLYVFGRAQDVTFEKPTNDVQNRGHIRVWKTEMRISGQDVWMGQASYDSGIELSATTHFPTHHIAPTIDWERNSVGADLETTGMVTAEDDATFTAPNFSARNGGGDFYASDGDVLVVNFTAAALPLQAQPVVVGGLKDGLFLLYDFLISYYRALGVLLGIGVVGVIAGVLLVRAQIKPNRDSGSPAR